MPELHCPLVLGYDWLRAHNPRIDWRAGLITLPQANRGCVADSRRVRSQDRACDFLLPSDAFEKMMRNPRIRQSTRVWTVVGRPRDAPAVAKLHVSRGTHGYRLRDPTVYRVLHDWLKPRGVSVDACIESASMSLSAGRVIADLHCPHC